MPRERPVLKSNIEHTTQTSPRVSGLLKFEMLTNVVLITLFAAQTLAKGGSDSAGAAKDSANSCTLKLNGKSYNGNFDFKDLKCGGTVNVRGLNNGFDID